MKTFIQLFFATTGLLVIEILAGERPSTPADFVAGIFCAALMVWTLRQYERRFPSLTKTRPLHLPLDRREDSRERRRRLAA